MTRNWSIKKKLMFISMTTSCAALALSTAGFLSYDLIRYRSSMREALATEGRIIGDNSAAALTFGDVKSAARVLGALRARQSVVSAIIFDANGEVFATYSNRSESSRRLSEIKSKSPGNFIRAESPIILEGKTVGTVLIEADDSDFWQRLVAYLAIVGALMLASATVAFLLSARLRKLITDPIVDLRAAMNDVSVRRDYSLRVPQRSPDELGELVDGFNRMIGDIQKAQADLNSLNLDLEHRVAERSRAAEERATALEISEKHLRGAKELAEQASRTKSAFLANMSHELRTPLNAIIGYSELLQEELEDMGSVSHLKDLARIQTAGTHLLSVINDILDLSKIEAGRVLVSPETFDLTAVVREAASTIASLLSKNSNTLTLNLPDRLTVYTDPTKVRQVLINLLGNSCKFTKSGSISVTAGQEEQTGCVLVSVEDSGIGIPNELIELLFEPFVQADASTTRKYGGTGLGLPISRRFSRMLGGDLTVVSLPDIGSTFTMKIPLNYEPPQINDESAVATMDSVPDFPLHGEDLVVIIDDDSNTCELLSRMLNKLGLRTIECNSGKAGIAAMKRYHPALVTLDVQMTGMDGWTILTNLKSDPELSSIPVFLVTIVDEKPRGLKMGATEYFTKPLNAVAFQAAVQKCRGTRDLPANDKKRLEPSHV